MCEVCDKVVRVCEGDLYLAGEERAGHVGGELQADAV